MTRSFQTTIVPTNGNGSAFSDPAFSSNKSLPIHRWVPWIAGFSSDFICDAFNKHLTASGTVLDPFSGVGTTLVEALLHGNNAYGFEINPYAAFAAETKVNSYLVNQQVLKHELLRYHEFYSHALNTKYRVKSEFPTGFKTRVDFYSPKVLHKVFITLDFIDTIEDQQIKDLFRLAFASTMIGYSNYSYEPSLGTRKAAGKEDVIDFPVEERIQKKINEMRDDIIWLKKHLKERHIPEIRTINDTFFNYRQYLDKASIDLIVTSPPYLNNYHYIRNTRPQLYWLGLVKSPKDQIKLEGSNFGNYWQTVRGKQEINPIFEVPDIDIMERIAQIRTINPERGIYGGSGWANYAISYFNDCYKFSKGIEFSLKRGGTALVVIGNSILQGVTIPTDEYFAKIAETVGLELVEIHIPRSKRIGNSIIQSTVRVSKPTKGHRLYEAVVELRNL
jgi:DNA modification methylase